MAETPRKIANSRFDFEHLTMAFCGARRHADGETREVQMKQEVTMTQL